jgi:hypothetical protein
VVHPSGLLVVVVTEVEDVVFGSVLRSMVVWLLRMPSSFLMVVVVS